VAAHRPHAISRLLHALLRCSSTDLQESEAAARTSSNGSRTRSIAQRGRITDTTGRFSTSDRIRHSGKTAELLKIDNEGLLPQTRTGFQSGLAAYQNNRQEFQSLFASFLEVLNLDEEYWQTLAERETALAQIEELTGLSLREQGANR
jgi:hypothetical protein